MPKCPKCNLEIDENVTICSSCNSMLLEEEQEEINEPAFLINVRDELQANVVVTLLKTYEIPVRKKYKGNDTFLKIYMSMTTSGIDIFVPQSALEQAKDIINKELVDMDSAKAEAGEALESDADMEALSREYDKKRRLRAWIILLFFTPGIIGIVFSIIYLIILTIMYN